MTLEQMRDDYDWQEVFRYAEGGDQQGKGPDVRRAAPIGDEDCSLEPFGLEDVAEITASSEGENDGPDWIAWGELKDGRYFSLRAGCDYTGWDCQASGHAEVASTRELMTKHGFTDDEAQRLGVIRGTQFADVPPGTE